MAKIILSLEGMVLREIPLTKERMTIGRKPHNDIHIDNLAISGEHAAIVAVHDESFLEDLNSTNGTNVNGRPIRKHQLQNGDVIELGKYRLKFVCDPASAHPAAAADEMPRAAIQVLAGQNAGKEMDLTKALTTLGKPGVQVAVIARRPNGYFITHVEGAVFPTVSGKTLSIQPHLLQDHDIIELGGVKMEFFFKS